ncbi:hypothetical protein ACRALDRAFT_2022658 [Sodiomyces alcalophilus JCM 7366]|uniref:uncharacterized protein n=1 Tax=Sodiomyces alcalophilus JCM 7366 TaxID=591952 RepID=UPI0039B5D09E
MAVEIFVSTDTYSEHSTSVTTVPSQYAPGIMPNDFTVGDLGNAHCLDWGLLLSVLTTFSYIPAWLQPVEQPRKSAFQTLFFKPTSKDTPNLPVQQSSSGMGEARTKERPAESIGILAPSPYVLGRCVRWNTYCSPGHRLVHDTQYRTVPFVLNEKHGPQSNHTRAFMSKLSVPASAQAAVSSKIKRIIDTNLAKPLQSDGLDLVGNEGAQLRQPSIAITEDPCGVVMRFFTLAPNVVPSALHRRPISGLDPMGSTKGDRPVTCMYLAAHGILRLTCPRTVRKGKRCGDEMFPSPIGRQQKISPPLLFSFFLWGRVDLTAQVLPATMAESLPPSGPNSTPELASPGDGDGKGCAALSYLSSSARGIKVPPSCVLVLPSSLLLFHLPSQALNPQLAHSAQLFDFGRPFFYQAFSLPHSLSKLPTPRDF